VKNKQSSTSINPKIKVYSAAQIAKIIGAGTRWTYRHLGDGKNGTIACTRVDGKIFVTEAALIQFLSGVNNKLNRSRKEGTNGK
jgi:hypothetical protein